MPVRPRLTRTTVAPVTGIVHLGPGAFFRAFNAIYTDEAMVKEGGDWGICAVSLRSGTARDQLAPQGCVYTAVEKGPREDGYKVVNAVTEVLVAPEDPEAVIDRLADPATRIVSLTITEKGYCHNPATGALDTEHTEVRHDLANPTRPHSALGFVTEALARRRADGTGPFTVLSCDNLPSNGVLARRIILEFAACRDADLADWIAAHVSFPATMVDRITPATTQADVAMLGESAGYHDPACVVHEPFRQWVIEDNFAAGRPAWEAGGAQFVQSVAAHELMKLRCLNGTHSTLAYLGYLAGFETIADTVADAHFSRLCERLWAEEILPTVPQPQGEDLPAYARALLERYRNPAIRHRTWQIAMDGSQKLPQRLLGTLRDNLDNGKLPKGICLAIAGWMRYVGGMDEAGGAIDVRDPMADRLKSASQSADTSAGKVAALLAVEEVFSDDLPRNAAFRSALEGAFDMLATQGAAKAVAAYAG